MNLKVSENICR